MELPFDIWREAAVRCVGRLVFAGACAIYCALILTQPGVVAGLREAAVLALAMAVALTWKCGEAERREPRKTAIWRELGERERPGEAVAAAAFVRTVRDVYGHFAFGALGAALALYAAAGALFSSSF